MQEIKGVSFPFRISGRGGVALSGETVTAQQHIKECLMTLLGTRERERVMRPYNGLEDLDIFFNDLNETTKNMAEYKIRELIQQYEPRVETVGIEITERELEGAIAFVVDVTYSERDTGVVSSVTVNM